MKIQTNIPEVDRMIPYAIGAARGLWKKARRHIEFEDLLSAALLALMESWEKFDPKRHTKFEGYAVCRIRGAVLDELRKWSCYDRRVGAAPYKVSIDSVGCHLGMLLHYAETPDYDEDIFLEELRASFQLTGRRGYIMERYHFDGATMQEIAEELGLKQARISQIHGEELCRLRSVYGGKRDQRTDEASHPGDIRQSGEHEYQSTEFVGTGN